MNINLLDLFSGIGGFSQGLKQAGFNINKHQHAEINKHANAIYKHQFPNAELLGDVRHVRGSDLGTINAITFGSPCQDFSLAGNRQGLDGDRSSLITEAIRLIDECRPNFFIWENVKGTFSSNSGEDFWAIIQTFANLGGYRLEWQLLNTSWFLPQNRERIYLVGRLAEQCRGDIFPLRKSDKICSEQKETSKKIHGDSEYAITQTARQFSNWTGQHVAVTSGTKKGYELARIGDSINLSMPTSKTRRGRVGKGKAQTLDCACKQAVIQAVLTPDRKKTRQNGRRIKTDGEPAFTLTTQDLHGVAIDSKIRRLTETECERLQGFKDNWTKYGNYDGIIKEVSKNQRYKCIGNAVTVDVFEAVAKQIINNTRSW